MATQTNLCVGCGETASKTCSECGKPTCGRAVGLCGHVSGLCALCLEERIASLNTLAAKKRDAEYDDACEAQEWLRVGIALRD